MFLTYFVSVLEEGDLFYCGYGLRADEIVDKSSIPYLAKPRHLYSVPKQDLSNASLQAGLHYLVLTTNNGTVKARTYTCDSKLYIALIL